MGAIVLDLPCRRRATDESGYTSHLAILNHLDLCTAIDEAALFVVVMPGVKARLDGRLGRGAFSSPDHRRRWRRTAPIPWAHAADVVGIGGEQLLGHRLGHNWPNLTRICRSSHWWITAPVAEAVVVAEQLSTGHDRLFPPHRQNAVVAHSDQMLDVFIAHIKATTARTGQQKIPPGISDHTCSDEGQWPC
jgi:hypothetical protein